MNLLKIILMFALCTSLGLAQSEFVYTINYVKSYRSDLIQKNMGCQQNNIAYGAYTYPTGVVDALFLITNQNTYQSRLNCRNKNVFSKIFGTAQNYNILLDTEPATVASRVAASTKSLTKKIIIDWKYPINGDLEKSRNWLNKFIQTLNDSAVQVYLKAPASYFCHSTNGFKYLIDLDKAENLIIQMYGEQAGVYKTYEEMFETQIKRQTDDKDKYPQASCPQYPSYLTLVRNFPNKVFFIEKTLQKEEAGYIGPLFKQYLTKGKDIYKDKLAFLDSYKQQLIQL